MSRTSSYPSWQTSRGPFPRYTLNRLREILVLLDDAPDGNERGDAAKMSDAMDETCALVAAIIKTLKHCHAAGERIEGDPYSIDTCRVCGCDIRDNIHQC